MNARITLDQLDPAGGLGTRLPRTSETVGSASPRMTLVNQAEGVWLDNETGRMKTLTKRNLGCVNDSDRTLGAKSKPSPAWVISQLALVLSTHNWQVSMGADAWKKVATAMLEVWEARGAHCPTSATTITLEGAEVNGRRVNFSLPAEVFRKIVDQGTPKVMSQHGEEMLRVHLPTIAEGRLRTFVNEPNTSAGQASTFVNVEKAYEDARSGTRTGRFSGTTSNISNLPKAD